MTAPQFSTIALDIDDGIATLWLDRPEKMNAFTPQMKYELIAAFDHTDANDDVRAVIVTGRGRAFCAGADLSSGGDTFDYDKRAGEDHRRDGGGQTTLRIFRSLKPVIGAINGAAVGIGATMQLPMDIRIASETAKFGFVFARRGITPEAASSWFLTRTVGLSTALEWCYSGRVFPASEARERGLVRSLHAPDDLYPAAVALAHELTDESAPVSVAMTRQMLWRMHAAGHPMDAHRIDSQAIISRGKSADAHEGVSSFLEKRAAEFPNKVSTDMPDFFDWQAEPPFD
ncbi:crotonase/enoyl-CoA hydratase family protein [Salinisphaera sp.]|uniref:crotonase/enoyl-CoA hydratase family protein n=1 Tax=Salinisphaera sp. TaxID=1914330 RepID=UPI000C6780B9|nr:crotonase/enoyl-CoA hydratase family protein [Salinisphaera sp.]MAS08673.1 enoyl-CoA hydratase [Salinisphaera sp.]|tara:strand:+ start:248 stop:1108 length:861 start_codon:yes stop_codon:yes gene_type:complete